jgi:hypothetical protein
LPDVLALALDGKEPIRAELSGPESLEAYARQLASWTRVTRNLSGDLLLRRSEETVKSSTKSIDASVSCRRAARP